MSARNALNISLDHQVITILYLEKDELLGQTERISFVQDCLLNHQLKPQGSPYICLENNIVTKIALLRMGSDNIF